jgi:aryl-alcohol dehydrogenase-like predicted oxidoreductase
MEYRRLGSSGFKVPLLSLGTGTFGGKGMLKAWGASDVKEARRLIDICLEAGLNMFDSADVYSSGEAERVLGGAIKGLSREDLIISTKATFRSGARANDVGSSRYHLTQAVEGALKRLGPITLTSSNCTPSTRKRRSRKFSRRSTTSFAPARSATSAARTSPAGT